MNERVDPIRLDVELSVADIDAMIRDQLTLADICENVRSPGHEDRIGHYMYVSTGGIFFPCDPRPEEVFIKDIAAGVSSITRFAGQGIKRVTVAEHLYLCSYEGPPATALERLLHDAPEGLIGDKIRPIKYIPILQSVFAKLEDGIMRVIAQRYRLQYPFPPCVKAADEATALLEVKENIKSKAPHVHYLIEQDEASNQHLKFWTQDVAEEMFLRRFYKLAGERGLSGSL